MMKTEKEKLTLEPPRGNAEGEKQQTREGPSGCQCVRSEHKTLKEEPELLRPKSGGREQGPTATVLDTTHSLSKDIF